MKKIFATLFAVLFLFSSAALATDNQCSGPDCYAAGNFDISTFAAGGGIDLDGKLIPNGAAGGISAAGGLTVGHAAGQVSTITVPVWVQTGRHFWQGYWTTKTLAGGTTEASIDSIGGGVTKTEAYKFTPTVGDIGIGVGSRSDSYAVTGAEVDVAVFGVASVEACVFGIAAQGSLDGSIVGGSPLGAWDSHGVSYGLAGQGSVGAFAGQAGAFGVGAAGFEAKIEMNGQTLSESYRAIEFNGPAKTEIMGTNVLAQTEVNTYGSDYDCGLAGANVDGGFIAAGGATSKTFQITDGGVAKATANGSYVGMGDLNCDFTGAAIGGTQTSATTVNGYNGAIMTSSAAMKVTAKSGKIAD